MSDRGRHLSRHPLALCLSAALAVSTGQSAAAAPVASEIALTQYLLPAATATITTGTNWVVSSCTDDASSGTTSGTLRYASKHAVSGDTIDLSGLPGADSACTNSTITLSQGEIKLAGGVSIIGPRNSVLTVSGNHASRVLYASGNLEISDLTIANGSSSIRGGCIVSVSTVTLHHVTIHGCTGSGYGGGIWAANLTLDQGSRLGGNKVEPNGLALSVGGGAFAVYSVSGTDSVVYDNSAISGGGLAVAGQSATFMAGSLSLTRCSVYSNSATSGGGGAVVGFQYAGNATIVNSTISSNYAASGGAGIVVQGSASVYNSTIANNTINNATATVYAGLYAYGLTAHGSLFANNTNNGTESDVQVGSMYGADNLVMKASVAPAAGVITVTADPQLQPLADNGGITPTMALPSNSPAIDKGDNHLSLTTDQRGGSFTRESPTGKPDIGAYEFNSDVIFANGFNPP